MISRLTFFPLVGAVVPRAGEATQPPPHLSTKRWTLGIHPGKDSRGNRSPVSSKCYSTSQPFLTNRPPVQPGGLYFFRLRRRRVVPGLPAEADPTDAASLGAAPAASR